MPAAPGNAASPSPPARGGWRGWSALAVGGLLVAYAATGLQFVQPDERGVARIFGRLTPGEAGPGLHYVPPWPIGRMDRPKTTQVRSVTVGLEPEARRQIAAGDTGAISASPRSDVLTGDTNILKITLTIQYQVTDPARYLLGTTAPEEWVRRASQAAMVETLARLPVDDVLTTARVQLRDAVMARAQQRLSAYETGIDLVSASVQTIEPPAAVIASFKDVTSANFDRARLIERARNTADTLIRDAGGYSSERTNAARVYEQNKLSRARGEAGAFEQRLAEYGKAPDVTKSRLFLTAMGRILPRVRKLVIDDGGGSAPVNIRVVDPGAATPGG